jgi:hypothetical protein
MGKFSKDDRVRVTNRDSIFFGRTGTVVSTDAEHWDYEVRFSVNAHSFDEDELEAA